MEQAKKKNLSSTEDCAKEKVSVQVKEQHATHDRIPTALKLKVIKTQETVYTKHISLERPKSATRERKKRIQKKKKEFSLSARFSIP